MEEDWRTRRGCGGPGGGVDFPLSRVECDDRWTDTVSLLLLDSPSLRSLLAFL